MKNEGSANNSAGVVSVVFGILSLVFGLSVLLGFFAGFACAVIALIFALVQRKKGKNAWSKAGLILAIIGLLFNVFAFYIVASWLAQVIAAMQQQLQAAGGTFPTQ